MVDNLEEALCSAGMTDLLGTLLHSSRVIREEVTEVDDGGDLCGRHDVCCLAFVKSAKIRRW